ncbi:unnamed protein product, partial [Timema podura]|nr:unnamed protein product [Timema podura]
MILEAAKSIAAANSALVKAASAAQRELIDLGKVSRRPLTSSDDGQWSEGLISAARLVAAATHSLVESANALVQGVSSEEKLISSAKQVASSTAQLLVACKVKADPDSDSTKRLQVHSFNVTPVEISSIASQFVARVGTFGLIFVFVCGWVNQNVME